MPTYKLKRLATIAEEVDALTAILLELQYTNHDELIISEAVKSYMEKKLKTLPSKLHCFPLMIAKNLLVNNKSILWSTGDKLIDELLYHDEFLPITKKDGVTPVYSQPKERLKSAIQDAIDENMEELGMKNKHTETMIIDDCSGQSFGFTPTAKLHINVDPGKEGEDKAIQSKAFKKDFKLPSSEDILTKLKRDKK